MSVQIYRTLESLQRVRTFVAKKHPLQPSLLLKQAKKFVKWAKKKWGRRLFFFLLGLVSMRTLMKTYGWLEKKSLSGKHVYITGASTGIGRLMAIIFAKQQAKVTLTGINSKGLESVCEKTDFNLQATRFRPPAGWPCGASPTARMWPT